MDVNPILMAVDDEFEGVAEVPALSSIISESEWVRAAVVGAPRLERQTEDAQRTVDVPIAMVLTNEQVRFAAARTLGDPDAEEAGSLAYRDLAGADVTRGVLELSTVDGITWRVPLPAADAAAEDAIARDLLWLGELRSRVIAARNDVDLAVGRIDSAAGDRDWEEGTDRYAATRATLDDLVQLIDLTDGIAAADLAPELTSVERRLERAQAMLLIQRAQSRLTLGQQLMENGDIEQASEVLDTAYDDYESAPAHATALDRGDAFVFGEQRAVETRLERLRWEMEAVAAEPLRQAHEAKMLAQSTADPDDTLEHWERAFHRFGATLALEWGEDEFVARDHEAIREELANAAGQLLAIHQTLARTSWDAGVEHQEAGAAKVAIRKLESAVDHLERAHEIAIEFRPEAASDMEARLKSMQDGVRRVREHGAPGSAEPPTAEETATEETDVITASELSQLDTHQEIALGPDAEVGSPEQVESSEGPAFELESEELDLEPEDPA